MTIKAMHMKWVLLVVLLVVLSACGGGGCEHLSCAPETGVIERVGEILEDAEDGIIDEGESELGDKILDITDELTK
ncbi:MAG: hypothetical protein R3E31_02855 [Chloroflexota bacterium]